MMPNLLVTLQLANQVRALRRGGLTIALIAAQLGRTEAEILETHRMVGIGIANEPDEPARLPDNEVRAAARANWPMKMRQRYAKRKR
jgi:hypothetical protein